MDGTVLIADDDRTIRTVLTQALTRAGIGYTSLDIHDSSLEDIFVGLLGEKEAA